MRRLIFGALICVLSACSRKVEGTYLTKGYVPIFGAQVSTNLNKRTFRSGANGYFKFRVQTMAPECRVMAWKGDTVGVARYRFGGGPIDIFGSTPKDRKK